MTVTSLNPDPVAQREIDRRRGRFVPWIIAAFYLTFMSALIVFVFIAYAHPPADSTGEAYDKGLAYNDTLTRADAQTALGWRSTAGYEAGHLTFSLTDRQGQPVDHAQAKAWFVHPDKAEYDRSFDLRAEGNGVYAANAPLPAKGVWTIHVTAAVDGHEYQSVTHIEIR